MTNMRNFLIGGTADYDFGESQRFASDRRPTPPKEKGLQVHPAARAKFLPNFQEQQTQTALYHIWGLSLGPIRAIGRMIGWVEWAALKATNDITRESR